jgi:WD repeat and SOF domain-containing protein 1
MQRVFCVNYSADSRFVLSGSDDTNIRIWKSDASKSLAVNPGRQDRKQRYDDTLKKRFAHMPEISRINRDQKLPKSIKKANQLKHVQRQSERRKQDNRKRHNVESDVAIEPERKKSVLKEYV